MNSAWEQAIWWLLVIIGFGGSALCSGLETAFYSASRLRLDVRAAAHPIDRAARTLQREFAVPDRLLASLLIGTNTFNYLGTLGVAALLTIAGFGQIAVIIISALILTPTLLVLAESVPKEVFRIEADRLTYTLAPFFRVLRLVLTLIGVLPGILLIARILSGSGTNLFATDARRRIAAMLKDSVGFGAISESQSTLVDRALDLGRRTVAEEMIPWRQAVTVSAEWPRDRLLTIAQAHPYTRYPVIDRRGKPIGILNINDAVLADNKDSNPLARDLMHDITHLDANEPVRSALTKLREAGGLALVMRRGTTGTSTTARASDNRPIGVITLKDLVEPLTGDLTSW